MSKELKIIPELKDLSLKLSPNADFSEVADTIGDLLRITDVIEKTLSNGWQRTDIFALLSVQPDIAEVVDDASIFVEQFLNLNESTSVSAINQAKTNYKGDGKIANWILNSLYFLATSFSSTILIQELAQKQIQMGRALFKGEDLFPEA